MRTIGAILTAAVLAGCASSADDVAPSYVSSAAFHNFNCQQLTEEARRVSQHAARAAGAQNRQARNDKIATGTALVLFWPAAFFVSGGNGANAAELANLRGQKEAIEQAAIEKNCGFSFRG
ncbi:MAG: hypothetical protein ACR2PI_12115 [Hyphomicrobiaceae bacterium]